MQRRIPMKGQIRALQIKTMSCKCWGRWRLDEVIVAFKDVEPSNDFVLYMLTKAGLLTHKTESYIMSTTSEKIGRVGMILHDCEENIEKSWRSFQNPKCSG